MDDIVRQLSEAIRAAAAGKRALRIRGGGTKDFYGGALRGDVLDVAPCRGIVEYEPTELVITARAGTPLAEVEAALREKGQMLAFEPPHFGDIPSPLSPPAPHPRPSPEWRGEARDSLLPLGEGHGMRAGARENSSLPFMGKK